jgi:hypothetical protein
MQKIITLSTHFERETFIHANSVHVLANGISKGLQFASWIISTVVIEDRRISNQNVQRSIPNKYVSLNKLEGYM